MQIQDLKPGTEIELGPRQIGRDEIIEFAKEFDQAPFHLDEEAAKKTMLGGLCASGWQTCGLTIRMMYDVCFKDAGYIGTEGIEECKWIKPVYVDDILSGTATLIKTDKSETGFTASFQYIIKNQNGEPVLAMKHLAVFENEGASNA